MLLINLGLLNLPLHELSIIENYSDSKLGLHITTEYPLAILNFISHT